MPAGVKVYVGACSGPWCKVSWSGHSGYAGKSELAIGAAPAHALPPAQSTRRPPRSCRSIRPIPIVRWYFDIPPYTAIEPSFYRPRYFMMAQERNSHREVWSNCSCQGGGEMTFVGQTCRLALCVAGAGLLALIMPALAIDLISTSLYGRASMLAARGATPIGATTMVQYDQPRSGRHQVRYRCEWDPMRRPGWV